MAELEWKILNEGRVWKGEEALQRYEQGTPEKLEMVGGKLLWSDEAREKLLGLLLENVADRAVQFGDPEVWRAAVASDPLSTEGPCPSGGPWWLGRLCPFGAVPPARSAEGEVDGLGRLYTGPVSPAKPGCSLPDQSTMKSLAPIFVWERCGSASSATW
jgi:hypothetical protein